MLPDIAREHSRRVRARLIEAGLHDGATWRVSPAPFLLTPADLAAIDSLGRHLLRFTRALNRLYYESVRGAQPRWAAEYLDQGKPSDLIDHARMHRFKSALPGVIRPDLILTEDGFMISELDSVPGGIGLTGCMAQAYADLGWSVTGGRNGMVEGFARMIRMLQPEITPNLAIVVSEEAKDYRPEMRWLAARLREAGLPAEAVAPEDVTFTEDGLYLRETDAVTTLYRFFELFDLKNIPKAELLLYAVKQGRVAMTPPAKPWLEEKLAFALLHHPALEPFWSQDLGEETFSLLRRCMPRTWILDPRPVPPHAVIPGLTAEGRGVSDWKTVAGLGQKGRRFALKPSGFSELAWGSRGVSVGHDLPQKEWADAIDGGLASFPTVPYILQEFRKGRRVAASWHDPVTDEIVPMEGRVRLSPYYFVTGEVGAGGAPLAGPPPAMKVELGGILATVCPLDKKLIHGMTDAVMAPCAPLPSATMAAP
ncbi:MAG: hypothetical protein EPO02_04550 [Nitrospirae bacterium]|nr:MAG: hypothetical protein EPO02_04550 [Nitrospirota bacterium]